MVAVARKIIPQTEIGGLEDPADEAAEIRAGYLWRVELWLAMEEFVSSYRAGGLKGYEAAAAALDKRWGVQPHGRTVSASSLRAALHDSERNNFRAEWLDWFACRSPEIADLLARRVKPIKTAEERLADLEAEMYETYPKHAGAVIRRSRTR